jgi:hypothetical protein
MKNTQKGSNQSGRTEGKDVGPSTWPPLHGDMNNRLHIPESHLGVLGHWAFNSCRLLGLVLCPIRQPQKRQRRSMHFNRGRLVARSVNASPLGMGNCARRPPRTVRQFGRLSTVAFVNRGITRNGSSGHMSTTKSSPQLQRPKAKAVCFGPLSLES